MNQNSRARFDKEKREFSPSNQSAVGSLVCIYIVYYRLCFYPELVVITHIDF